MSKLTIKFVAQLIKPVTHIAGELSWALMENPKGLKCDLFVTHGWAEGIYEFIDKLLHAWPRDSKFGPMVEGVRASQQPISYKGSEGSVGPYIAKGHRFL